MPVAGATEIGGGGLNGHDPKRRGGGDCRDNGAVRARRVVEGHSARSQRQLTAVQRAPQRAAQCMQRPRLDERFVFAPVSRHRALQLCLDGHYRRLVAISRRADAKLLQLDARAVNFNQLSIKNKARARRRARAVFM